MGEHPSSQKDVLTGRRRYRTTWLGRLVLQVEYRVASDGSPGTYWTRWRDAKVGDVTLQEADDE